MPVVDVKNKKGEKVSEINLSDDVFAVPVKSHVLHEVVVMQLAARRRGTADVKNRSDVSFSGKKMHRQKGTGRARRGNRRSPLLKGGGVVFGPHPRSYEYRVPKKVRKLALKMALSSKLSDDCLKVVDALSQEAIKTKEVALLLNALEVKNALFVVNGPEDNFVLSARNIPGVCVLPVEGLNVYDLLKHRHLVLDSRAVEGIYGRFSA
ncbi:MAG: 50S ribosomal protein L4 [Thermodesulfobacteriota bacterium]